MSTNASRNTPEDEALGSALANWRKTVEAELKGAAFDKKLVTRTPEGVAVQPLYTRADLASRHAHAAALAKAPGETPFLRGSRSAGGWQVAQEIAAATPAEFNARLRNDLMAGQDAAVIVAATPARPSGLSLASDTALEVALDGVELSAIPVHIDAGAVANEIADRYLALVERRGVDAKKLSGSLTADPLGAWAVAGALPVSPSAAFEALASWTKRAAKAAPALKTIGVDARLWADAGGSAAHELGFALAAVAETLRALRERGVELSTSAPRLRVSFGAGPQFLMEIAKFRAWRPLLTRVVVALGGEASLAGRAATHASTTRWNKTRLDAHVNMLRATTEAFAAVLGGVDSLHISPFDALDDTGTGDAFARRIARNVHVMLAEEFGAAGVVDPAGGSWCVESLTDELGRKAWKVFQDVEAQGGFSAALRAGALQAAVVEGAKEKAAAAGSRRNGIVGTNIFPNLKEVPLPAPARVECAERWTSDPVAPVAAFRVAAGFERLRDASAAHAAKTGKRPRVFLAKMGPLAQHKARADFSAGFFAPGGFEVLAKQSFATVYEAAAAFAASGAGIVVLCSTDETYPELVPAFAAAVKAANPSAIRVLAGLPADKAAQDAFTAAGIDLFIHLRAPVEDTLATLLKKTGVLA